MTFAGCGATHGLIGLIPIKQAALPSGCACLKHQVQKGFAFEKRSYAVAADSLLLTDCPPVKCCRRLSWLLDLDHLVLNPHAMHIVAMLVGVLIHIWGDLFVCYAALIVWRGHSAFSPDMFQDLPTRPGMAIRVIPIPIILSISGLAMIYWSYAKG